MALKITAYGGIEEIGGNAFLVQATNGTILIDFGHSFKREGIYFAGYLQPRVSVGLTDLLEYDIIPYIPHLYSKDFGLSPKTNETDTIVDACFLSHAHIDHFGRMNLLNEEIPLYMGETAKMIIQSIQDTSRPTFGRPYIRPPTDETSSNIRTFRTGDVIQLGDMDISPIHVDHSLPGAYGFIIEDRHKDIRIGYTGDLRLHGWRKDLTKDFITATQRNEPLQALLIEGTNVDTDFDDNEEQVQQDLTNAIGKTDELVVANYSLRDMDRFRSFYLSAKANGRKMLIPTKQAYLLRLLEEDIHLDIPSLADPVIEVYKKPMKKRYYRWETSIFEDERVRVIDTVSFDQTEYIFHTDFWELTNLIDVRPAKGSTFLYCHGDPFDDEGVIDFNRMQKWIEHFQLNFKQYHASGHAPKSDLKKIVEAISPELVVPIHSEHPEKYRDLIDIPILLTKRGQTITI